MCFQVFVRVPWEYNASRGQKRESDPLELALQAVVSYDGSAGTKLGSLARTINVLNHWAISPAPSLILKKILMSLEYS